MDTKRISDIEPLRIDGEILALAEQHAGNPYPGIGRHVAILNDRGQIYRVITLFDPIDASRFVCCCTVLGMVDRVGWSNVHLHEVDSLTGDLIKTSLSAILQVGREPHPLPTWPL